MPSLAHLETMNEDAALQKDHMVSIHFKGNIFGSTHFWATAKNDNGYFQAFNVYNEGAPKGDNVYELRDWGIWQNGIKHADWRGQ